MIMDATLNPLDTVTRYLERNATSAGLDLAKHREAVRDALDNGFVTTSLMAGLAEKQLRSRVAHTLSMVAHNRQGDLQEALEEWLEDARETAMQRGSNSTDPFTNGERELERGAYRDSIRFVERLIARLDK